MTIFDKMQPVLDQLVVDAIGPAPTFSDQVEFANTLVNRAAGIICGLAAPGVSGHDLVQRWLECWLATAEQRAANSVVSNVHR